MVRVLVCTRTMNLKSMFTHIKRIRLNVVYENKSRVCQLIDKLTRNPTIFQNSNLATLPKYIIEEICRNLLHAELNANMNQLHKVLEHIDFIQTAIKNYIKHEHFLEKRILNTKTNGCLGYLPDDCLHKIVGYL